MSSNGGGSSSWADLPDYIENAHRNLMTGWRPGLQDSKELIASDSVMDAVARLSGSYGAVEASTNPFSKISNINYGRPIYSSYGGEGSSEKPYDPSSNLESIQEAIAELRSTDLALFPEGTNLSGYLQQAVADIKAYFEETIASTLDGEITSIISGASTKANQALSSSSGAAAMSTRIQFKSLEPSIKNDVKSSVTSLMEAADSIQLSNHAALAKSSVEEAINTAITLSHNSLSSVIDAAVAKAVEVVGNAYITTAVEEYESSTNSQHLRGVGRFAAESAGAGAVNASGHKMGLAVMEYERARDVNKFEADLKLQVFRDILGLYATKGDSMVSNFLQGYIQEYQLRLQETQMKITEMVKAYIAILGQTLQTYKELTTAAMQYGVTLVDSQIKSYYDLYQATHTARNTAILEYMKTGVSTDKDRLTQKTNIERLLADVERMSIIANKEYYDRDIELKTSMALFNLDVLQKGANVLAAPVGGVATAGQANKATGSALGGTLSGAVTGATVGSEISPGYGTVIGAVVGGIAGYLSS